MDLSILNYGKANTLDPIPIMFIPSSSKKIIKQADPHVLTTFLKPLMIDLKRVFVDGFPVQYAYPIESISECMFDDLPFDLATLQAIVMVWTSDHFAQCEMGGILCRNPGLGLTTKARCDKVAGQEGDPGVTLHAPRSAKNVRE
jgi:hypothetical protein